MAYSIVHTDSPSLTNLYAIVQRSDDAYYWDVSGGNWVAIQAATAEITLAETPAGSGSYQASAAFTPIHGTIYTVFIYDGSDTLIVSTELVYVEKKTALEIVNEVQKELRLPQSSLITEAHAQLMLSFANKVIQGPMMEAPDWPELILRGRLMLKQGVTMYTIRPVNGGTVDFIETITPVGYEPLIKRQDGDFRVRKRGNDVSGQNQPTDYRIYSRAGGNLIFEITPAPDQNYEATYEARQQPGRLLAATDYSPLNDDLIIMGTLAVARTEAGQDSGLDNQAFAGKLEGQIDNQTEPNWGDANTP